jgi:hypothetical protein
VLPCIARSGPRLGRFLEGICVPNSSRRAATVRSGAEVGDWRPPAPHMMPGAHTFPLRNIQGGGRQELRVRVRTPPSAVEQLEGVRDRPRRDLRTIAVCRMRPVDRERQRCTVENPVNFRTLAADSPGPSLADDREIPVESRPDSGPVHALSVGGQFEPLIQRAAHDARAMMSTDSRTRLAGM